MSPLLSFLPTMDDRAKRFKEFKILLESCTLTIPKGDEREETETIEDWGVKYACVKVRFKAYRIAFLISILAQLCRMSSSICRTRSGLASRTRRSRGISPSATRSSVKSSVRAGRHLGMRRGLRSWEFPLCLVTSGSLRWRLWRKNSQRLSRG